MWRILVIDDNELTRKTLELVLTLEGYRVETANSGRDGFYKLNNSPYDLLIADIMMPFTSGFEVINRFRQLKNIYSLPILVITSLSKEETIVPSIKPGVDDFIRKPIIIGELLFKIKKLLKTNQDYNSPPPSIN